MINIIKVQLPNIILYSSSFCDKWNSIQMEKTHHYYYACEQLNKWRLKISLWICCMINTYECISIVGQTLKRHSTSQFTLKYEVITLSTGSPRVSSHFNMLEIQDTGFVYQIHDWKYDGLNWMKALPTRCIRKSDAVEHLNKNEAIYLPS